MVKTKNRNTHQQTYVDIYGILASIVCISKEQLSRYFFYCFSLIFRHQNLLLQLMQVDFLSHSVDRDFFLFVVISFKWL